MDALWIVAASPAFWFGLTLIVLAIAWDIYDAWASGLPWCGIDLHNRRRMK